ncbi:MAG TPA: extracellular solute-binding protein [Herbaspirillum sp.]|jgi:iron(III) transport system substrate-binding protein
MKSNARTGNGWTTLRKTAQHIALTALAAVALAQPLHAQNVVGKNDQAYLYSGADRMQRILEKARAEGSMTFYTSMSTVESRPLADAFTKKYGIKVELWRAPNEALLQRILTEAQSNRNSFDVVETNATEAEAMSREQRLSAFYTPYLADFPAAAVPAHHMWMPDRFNYLVTAYNTNKVKKEDLPKTYEGFKDPKWKGRVAIEAGDWDWMATVVQKMGQEKGTAFFKDFAATKPELRKGHPLMAQLIGSGEVQVGLTTFLANVVSGKEQHIPIDYAPVQPVLAVPFAIGVAKQAPHPYAALLFADFVLSPEGQEVLNELGRLPASNKIKNNPINFPFTVLDINASLADSLKRQKIWNALFLN